MDFLNSLKAADELAIESWVAPAAKSRVARIAMIGNFLPRRCGIATFTTDIHAAFAARYPDVAVDVWAMNDREEGYDFPEAVKGVIEQDDPVSYSAAAQAINASGADIVYLQHEFGIFGGPAGEHILHLVEQVDCPLATMFHTVLKNPDGHQRRVMDVLIARSVSMSVMAEQGRRLLVDVYGADPARITVIPHGIPDRTFADPAPMKARFGFGDRPVILTFGLLSPGKGIETMIEAIASVVKTVPDALYVVLGATHPNLVAQQGEAYRDKLHALAAERGISGNISFIDTFVEIEDLLDYLSAADIYATPYLNPEQVTSGTLAYSVGLGKAVVSTPYVHAVELFADGAGCLVDFGDAQGFADAITGLLADPARLDDLRRRTYALGRTMIWPRFAETTLAAFETARPRAAPPRRRVDAPITPVGTAALSRMTDDTGIFQHSRFAVPDRAHGYCVDDNARALMLAVRAPDIDPTVYAAFVEGAWNGDLKAYRNFMRFDRGWCEERGSDDSFGRTIWALGVAASEGAPGIREWASERYDRALDAARGIESIHARAFIMLGAAARLAAGEHVPSREVIARFGDEFAALLEANVRPDWPWFEIVLAYDNCRLPEALIRGGRAIGRDDLVEAGLETLEWIAGKQTAKRGFFRPVGHESFGRPFAEPLPFDQQPVEAWATIDACAAAFAETGDAVWRDRAMSAWRWFFGDNDLGVALADPLTGDCKDGLNPTGVNQNRGAESILAFQMSALAMQALCGGTAKKPGTAQGMHLAVA